MRFSGKSDQVSLYGKRFFRGSPIDEERRWHHGYHGLPVKLESPLNFQVNFRFRDFRGAKHRAGVRFHRFLGCHDRRGSPLVSVSVVRGGCV